MPRVHRRHPGSQRKRTVSLFGLRRGLTRRARPVVPCYAAGALSGREEALRWTNGTATGRTAGAGCPAGTARGRPGRQAPNSIAQPSRPSTGGRPPELSSPAASAPPGRGDGASRYGGGRGGRNHLLRAGTLWSRLSLPDVNPMPERADDPASRPAVVVAAKPERDRFRQRAASRWRGFSRFPSGSRRRPGDPACCAMAVVRRRRWRPISLPTRCDSSEHGVHETEPNNKRASDMKLEDARRLRYV